MVMSQSSKLKTISLSRLTKGGAYLLWTAKQEATVEGARDDHDEELSGGEGGRDRMAVR